MVDASSDFAVPFNSWESNVAVGASSTPIHVAALVVQIGRGHWLFRESLHPVFLYTNSALKTTLPGRRIFTSMNRSWGDTALHRQCQPRSVPGVRRLSIRI